MRLYEKLAGSVPLDFTKEEELDLGLEAKLSQNATLVIINAIILAAILISLVGREKIPLYVYILYILFTIYVLYNVFIPIKYTFAKEGILLTTGYSSSKYFYSWSAFENFYEGNNVTIFYLKDPQGVYTRDKTNIYVGKGKHIEQERIHVPNFCIPTGKNTERMNYYFLTHLEKMR
jgi:hypothetical protein